MDANAALAEARREDGYAKAYRFRKMTGGRAKTLPPILAEARREDGYAKAYRFITTTFLCTKACVSDCRFGVATPFHTVSIAYSGDF